MKSLSLILPTYNVNKYIIRCLTSIVEQTLSHCIELVIVDDESPDNSIQLAVDYLKSYPVKIIHQKNRGLGGARNTGIQKAQGDYLWFVDPDDEITSNSLKCVLSSLHSQDIAVFDYVNVDKNGTECTPSFKKKGKGEKKGGLGKNVGVSQVWRCIYRRNFLIQNGIYFREHFLHEDGEFNMRAFCLAESITHVPFVIYRYHIQNGGSIMNNIKLKNQIDLLYELDTAKKLKENYPFLSDEKKGLIHQYVGGSLVLMFFNILKLSSLDRKSFRCVLKKYRKRIISEYLVDVKPIYRKMLLWLELYLPYRFFINLVYNKKLW